MRIGSTSSGDKDGIATVTFDRPPVNAQNRQSREEAIHLFDVLSDRDDVRSIIADQLGKDTARIKPYHTFERLGADDLDLVEIVIRVEYTLGVSIDV